MNEINVSLPATKPTLYEHKTAGEQCAIKVVEEASELLAAYKVWLATVKPDASYECNGIEFKVYNSAGFPAEFEACEKETLDVIQAAITFGVVCLDMDQDEFTYIASKVFEKNKERGYYYD